MSVTAAVELMWSSVVSVSVQLETGDGSRSGLVTISCWPWPR